MGQWGITPDVFGVESLDVWFSCFGEKYFLLGSECLMAPWLVLFFS
jgi:hypothetical protein